MIGNASELTAQLNIQSSELDQLRSQAARTPERALKGAAQQFEALFLNTLLKSMRDASSGDGLFDSEQTKLYTSMLDQQFAQTLSKRGIGLAEMMVKQLRNKWGELPTQRPAPLHPLPSMHSNHCLHPRHGSSLSGQNWRRLAGRPQAVSPPKPRQRRRKQKMLRQHRRRAQQSRALLQSVAGKESASTPRGFVERLAPQAREVAAELGIPEKFLIGHAALESGWGRREPRFPDGNSSHNLFGIKADRSWNGPVVEVTTTEYVNGRREVVKDQFRAYASYAESLRDYADFLRSNPRYAQVLEGEHDAVGFARSLQSAGYATDPRYAEKLAGVINGPTMRASLTA